MPGPTAGPTLLGIQLRGVPTPREGAFQLLPYLVAWYHILQLEPGTQMGCEKQNDPFLLLP